MTPDENARYISFLKNPQQIGAWCLRVHLTEEAQVFFQKLLNLHPGQFRHGSKYRLRPSDDGFPLDITPVVLIRLFAYLRASLPKKLQSELPNLTSNPDRLDHRPRGNWNLRRYSYELKELATLPNRLSYKKRTELLKRARVFQSDFTHLKCAMVPENPGKVDFSDSNSQHYFQASQEPHGMLKVFSVQEETILKLRELLKSIADGKLETELIRVFSPEPLLMELYVPIVRLLRPENIIPDVSAIKNLDQVLVEINEERFVHAIRAIGIAAEELVVEIYETYIHEKAPATPLGELLSTLHTQLKEIVHGQPKKRLEVGDAKKAVGKFIEQEKKKTTPSTSIVDFAVLLQKTVLPLLEDLSAQASESSKSAQRDVKVSLFPAYVQRCVGELVGLRNRVSHRVERVASSVINVGYVEASLAIRAYVVLSSWWRIERSLIDYKQTRKKIAQETAARSASQIDESDELPTAAVAP